MLDGNGGGPYVFLDCANYGEITTLTGWHNGAGGIIGRTNNGTSLTIVNSFNKGTVSVLADNAAYTGAGGLIGTCIPGGAMETISIYNSFNDGNITGGKAGGLLGNINPTKLNIFNSYNLTTTADANAGIIDVCSANTETVLENVFYVTNSYVGKEPTNVTKENVCQVAVGEIKSKSFIDELNLFVTTYNTSEDKEDFITLKPWVLNKDNYPEFDKQN